MIIKTAYGLGSNKNISSVIDAPLDDGRKVLIARYFMAGITGRFVYLERTTSKIKTEQKDPVTITTGGHEDPSRRRPEHPLISSWIDTSKPYPTLDGGTLSAPVIVYYSATTLLTYLPKCDP